MIVSTICLIVIIDIVFVVSISITTMTTKARRVLFVFLWSDD